MQITRRTLIAGSGLALVACSREVVPQEPAPVEPPARDPSEQTELALIALYTAVRAAYPDLDEPLADIAAQHVAHLQALGGQVQALDPPPVARTQQGALDQCMVAETQAANAHQSACLTAEPVRARLLTLLSASEASHVPALANVR